MTFAKGYIFVCFECGRPYVLDSSGVSHHLLDGVENTDYDYDTDADHTAYGDETA